MAGTSSKLYVISNGYIENDVALNLLLHNQATADDPHKPADWHRVPSISLLIVHPRLGRVLVDTGSHPEAMQGYWPEEYRQTIPLVRSAEDRLEARLAELGLTASDIDLLVLTHLHLDHAGGLGLFAGTRAGQRVLVHEQELKQALYEVFSGPSDHASGYLRGDFAGLPGITFEPVETEEGLWLADDLQLLWLPGHTAGLLGVMLDLERSGSIIYASDAVNSAANYGPPAHLPANSYDSRAMLRSIERVRALARRKGATVLFGHDLDQYRGLRHAPAAYYD